MVALERQSEMGEEQPDPTLPPPPHADTFIRFRFSHADIIPSKDPHEYDTTLSPFYPQDVLRNIPVIRIFGATDRGQRVMANVRGAFPYVYVEYKGKLDPDSVNAHIFQLAKSLNRAMSLSFKRPSNDPNRPPQFVAFIVLCKGTPFYGYQVGYKTYLKIYILDPKYKTRLSEVLRSGAVMKIKFEVYEDHIPFMLQFMLDTNLYGCGWVEVGASQFRHPIPDHEPTASEEWDPERCDGPFSRRLYTALTVPPDRVQDSTIPKSTYCTLELDLPVSSILNSRTVQPRDIHQDFIEKLHPDQVERGKLVLSVRELWDDEKRRRLAKGESGPHDFVDSTPREIDEIDLEENPLFDAEKGFREKMNKMADEDLKKYVEKLGLGKKPTFETYLGAKYKMEGAQKGYLERVRTTFEQVDAAYRERWERDQDEEYIYGVWGQRGIGLSHEVKREVLAKSEEVDEEALRMATQGRAFSEDDEGVPLLERLAREEKEEAQVRYGSDIEEEELEREESVAMGDLEEEEEMEEEVGVPMDDCQYQESPTKKQRVESPLVQSPARYNRSSPSRSPVATRSKSSTPLVAARNPFSSPTKATHYKLAYNSALATSSSPPPPAQHYTAFDLPTNSFEEGPPPTQRSRIKMELDDDFADLAADAFADDYQPTPTLFDPGISTLPNHLRSVVVQETVEDEEEDRKISVRSTSSPLVEFPILDPEEVASSAESWKPSLEKKVVVQEESPILSSLSPTVKVQQTMRRVAFQVPEDEATSGSSREISSGKIVDPSPGTKSSGDTVESYETRARRALNPDQPVAPNSYAWAIPPPTSTDLVASMSSFGRSNVVYKDPYYSDPADVPAKAREYAGRKFTIEGDRMKDMRIFEHFEKKKTLVNRKRDQTVRIASGTKWEFAATPPTPKEAKQWLVNEALVDGISGDQARRQRAMAAPQIEGPTQPNDGFKFISAKGAETVREKQHLSLLTMELQVATRRKLRPDPKKDAIQALFYCLASDNDDLVANGRAPNRRVGVIAVGGEELRAQLGKTNYLLELVDSERELLDIIVDKVRTEWDPEIMGGFEIHHASWGFLLERALEYYDWRLVDELGRVMRQDTGKFGNKSNDRWGYNESSTLNFSGRHTVNIWRILRADNNLLRYDFEHCAFHILRQRTPHFSFETLSKWYASGTPHLVARVFEYWRNRVEMDLELLDAAEFISQNSEAARVFGVDFKSVRTRGSQFKVEAMMFRIAKPESFLLLSPNRVQVGKQNAAECQPLVMEPRSAFYKGPLLVLDFQSLYPSVMIAYNLCYSTCLGRVGTYLGTNKLGVTDYKPAIGELDLLRDDVNISPNGFMFVKPEIRKSLLAKMLSELLDTRVMVKTGMKDALHDVELTKMLNGRQLALKYLANVTYGYTSATFSGRMPCVEIADAIVQTGRETLERALNTIHATREWGAVVVYGDTDSLFVSLPGKSKDEAFRIGHEMAAKITSQNPRPIKLKFEKVYLPCVLLAKKRYVGFKYERESDVAPDFDAKGIETVRRDGIPALQKMLETCLRILFQTSDLSLVKSYCQRQWRKLEANTVSPHEFTYAKEVRLGTYSAKIPPPPGAAVAARRAELDPRGEPEYGDRIPYLLIQSEPGALQVNKALAPEAFVADPQLRLDAKHYINKVLIPPLARVFNLLGADVASWYKSIPKRNELITQKADGASRRALLDSHFVSNRCVACDDPDGVDGLCEQCRSHPSEVAYHLLTRTKHLQQRQQASHAICSSCSETPLSEPIACDSIDCPLFYERAKIASDLQAVEKWTNQVNTLK